MNLLENIIENTGISLTEAKIYLELLKLGDSKVGAIITNTSLQSSGVHNALKSLIEKGFISFILKDKIKHYFPLNPKVVEELIQSKAQSFSSIIPKLEILKKDNIDISLKVEIFTGKKGMTTASLKIFENSNKGDLHKYFGVDHSNLNDEIIDFFKIIETRRKASQLKVKGISHLSNKEKLEDYDRSNIKFTSQTLPPPMSIFKDKVIFYTFENTFSAILVESKELASHFHKLWNEIYNKIN